MKVRNDRAGMNADCSVNEDQNCFCLGHEWGVSFNKKYLIFKQIIVLCVLLARQLYTFVTVTFCSRREPTRCDRGSCREQSARPRHQPSLQPLHRLHRGGAAPLPPLQPANARRFRQRALRDYFTEPAIDLWSFRVYGPGAAHREVSAISRPAPGQYSHIQREVLYFLRPSAG